MSTTVVPWYSHGHRRAYVTADDGTRIGYLDLETGEAREVPAGRGAEFRAAIATWQRPAPGYRPRPGRQWVDLADNAREQPPRGLVDRLLGAIDEHGGRDDAHGAAETARRLRGLTDPGLFSRRAAGIWRVLHGVPVGRSGREIDHIVIGPPGLFLVDSRRHDELVTATAAAVFMGRRRTRYAEIARDEAEQAARLLSAVVTRSVPVTPLIAVVGAPVTVRGRPCGVTVLRADRLVDWLATQPPRYPDEIVLKLFTIARRSTTWRP